MRRALSGPPPERLAKGALGRVAERERDLEQAQIGVGEELAGAGGAHLVDEHAHRGAQLTDAPLQRAQAQQRLGFIEASTLSKAFMWSVSPSK